MTSFAPPKGMRDFYPEAWRAREALFNAWREAAGRSGFEMYDACVVETLDLLERKAGEEIGEQIYAFEDKSGNRLALRPELTPSLARLIVARQGELAFPLKWSAIAQCFRYERMQRGRKREHYQLNMDIVGEPSVVAEVEVIGAAVAALRALGLTEKDVAVRIGSRALLMELFAASGVADEHFMACCLALDKRGKIDDDKVAELLRGEGVGKDDIQSIFTMIGLDGLGAIEAHLSGKESPALGDLKAFFAAAEAAGIADWLVFDLGVIRGLGYYTGIVFEAFDRAGKFRAIFGGGRYDSLLSMLGGQKTPCVGLGFGDVVVMEILTDLGKAPAGERAIDFAVGFMEDAAQTMALKIASILRAQGASCDLAMKKMKPRKFFDRANKGGAKKAIFLGGAEVESGQFEIKDMAGGENVKATLQTLQAS